jgi:hypothetical protein
MRLGGASVWHHPSAEGGRRWHAMRRHARMGGGGLGILRKEKGIGWAGATPQRPGGPERSGGLR